ncbi:MAG: hypothetical protein KF696_10910 [Planctomycetes bacterium]|nr:hypothetical protein [Planctomycetota bacterium]MCW8135839.1 hypothetical protein [Planctomycetota bacterium]
MRVFLMMAALVFGAGLSAQLTAGLSIDQVIHEPSESEAGPFLGSLTVPNPLYDPTRDLDADGVDDTTGAKQFLPLIGNGNGLHHLDSVSGEMYALAKTTTHDLIILTNNTGADIIVDLDFTTPSPGALSISQTRAAVSPATAPEQSLPDPTATLNIYGYDPAAVSVPNGSSVAIALIVTRWAARLDTSPRDYFVEFSFTDLASNTTMRVEAALTVPYAGGADSSTACSSRNGPLPRHLLLLIGGGAVAIVTRRKLLRKARA